MENNPCIAVEEIAEALMRKIASQGNFRSLAEVFDFLVSEVGVAEEYAARIGEEIVRNLGPVAFPPIRHLELFLTENCNLHCDYCFVQGKNRSRRMSVDTGKKAIDFLIRESKGTKEIDVVFFGGEPILEFRLIQQLVDYAKKQGQLHGKSFSYSMTTNGTLLNKKILRYMGENRIKILVSLDGDQETHDRYRRTLAGHGSFDLSMSNLKLLQAYQSWVGVRITVVPEAADKLSQNIQYLADHGVNQFLFALATGMPWPLEAKQRFEKELIRLYGWWREAVKSRPIRISFFEDILAKQVTDKRNAWGCRAGRNSVVVSARGEIYPCSMVLGLNELRGVCKLGDVTQGITDIEMRKRLIGLSYVSRNKCYRCLYRTECLGGCYASNYMENGDIFQPSQEWECDFKAIYHRVTEEIKKQDQGTGMSLLDQPPAICPS